MAGLTHGMNTSGMRSAAAELNQRAADLAQIGAGVQALLRQTHWVGPSAERALTELPEQARKLDSVRTYLETIAAAMVTEAQAQEVASNS